MVNKDKKYNYEQIEYVNDLLHIFGFKGLHDYETKISLNNINDKIINKINKNMDKFKKFFPTKEFNLSRKKFKIDSKLLALAFLKKCLTHIGANFENIRKNGIIFMRLKPINKMLLMYIEHKMSDIEPKKMYDIPHEIRNIEELVTKSGFTLVRVTKYVQFNIGTNGLILNIETPVKKIILFNLPSKYTYTLCFNGHAVCNSKLDNEKQVFDFSDMNDNIEFCIWREITRKNNEYMNSEESKTYLDLSAIEEIKIKVLNEDPYDNFHIYNPKTGKCMFSEYTFIVEGLYLGEEGKKIYYTDKYTAYPNNTLVLKLNHPIEKLILHNDWDTKLIIDSLCFNPDEYKYVYTFDNDTLTYSEKYQGENSLSKLKKNTYGRINNTIDMLFPEYGKKISQITINTSRTRKQWLQIDPHLDSEELKKCKITSISYNLQMYDPITEKPVFRFIS